LLDRFVTRRDPVAFEALVTRHGSMVLAVCRRVVGDWHLAEDAFQATFLVLARRAAVINPRDAVRGWLYGVAVRTARGVHAMRTRRREALVSSVPDQPALGGEEPDHDAVRILHEEIARLPGRLRAPVVLCELDGLSRRDAAGRLGVPEGTLSSRLATARTILATRLRSRGMVAVGLAGLVDRSMFAAVVPQRLTDAAVRTTVPGSIPGGVSELARGVLLTMFLRKLQTIVIGAIVFTVALVGFSLASGQPTVSKPADPPAKPRTPVHAADPEPTPAQIRAAAVKGIADNYARLKTVKATVERVGLDPGVKEREVTTTVLPNGGTATLVREPRSTSTGTVILRGEEVRCEAETKEGSEVWAFTAGVWTQYHPADKRAWLRRADQMPGMCPVDPREAGNTAIRDRLLDRLRDDKLIRADKVGTNVVVVVEGAGGRHVRYEFDPVLNYLPTRVCYLHDDGSVNEVVDVTYQEVGRGKTWFPKEITASIYGRPGAKAGDPGWTCRTTWTIGKVVVDEPLPAKAFEVALPPDTTISDATTVPKDR
jgi:RNA polymerase sigma factor (sigma-70 family)